MTVLLRPASIADAPLLCEWDNDEDVGYSGGEDDTYDWEYELPRNVPWRDFLIAEVNQTPIGMVVLISASEEESHYWGNDADVGAWAIDIWIGSEQNRSKGFGTEMMRLAIARCFDTHGATSVLIDPLASNTRAIKFYERLGFETVGPRRFGDDDCIVLSMTNM